MEVAMLLTDMFAKVLLVTSRSMLGAFPQLNQSLE
jgi:hypothetical protein